MDLENLDDLYADDDLDELTRQAMLVSAQSRQNRQPSGGVGIGSIISGLGQGLGSIVAGNYNQAAQNASQGIQSVEQLNQNRYRQQALEAQGEMSRLRPLLDLRRQRMQQERRDKELNQKFQNQLLLLQAKNDQKESIKSAKGSNSATRSSQRSQSEKDAKPDQFKAGGYGKNAELAEKDLNNLLESGYKPQNLSSFYSKMTPDYVMPENAKLQAQAERNFALSILRRQSGATITDSELESAAKRYFPRPGDGPNVLKQKQRNRLQEIANLKAEAGGAWDKIPSIEVPSSGQTKVVEGVTYRKVPGGWEEI